MFDREEAAVRQNADRHAALVLDPMQAEILFARCLPTSLARRHHCAFWLAAHRAESVSYSIGRGRSSADVPGKLKIKFSPISRAGVQQPGGGLFDIKYSTMARELWTVKE